MWFQSHPPLLRSIFQHSSLLKPFLTSPSSSLHSSPENSANHIILRFLLRVAQFYGRLSKNCGANLNSTEGSLHRYWETLDRGSEVICSLPGTLLNSKGITRNTHFHMIPDHTSFRGNFQREDYFENFFHLLWESGDPKHLAWMAGFA